MSLASPLLLWAALLSADAGPLAPPAASPAVDAGLATPVADAGPSPGADAGATAVADAGAIPRGDKVAGGPSPAQTHGPAAAPAGDGGTTVAEPTRPAAAGYAARVHERDSPLQFRVDSGGKDARRRAAEAGAALAAALETDANPDEPVVVVAVSGDIAQVRVRGRAVATLGAADAAAEGAPSLASYAEELETRLLPFVQDELRRSSAQAIALSVFLFVFFGLLGVLTTRALRNAFDRIEKLLEERRAALQPLKILSIPLLSGEALRGLLLMALFVGRILAYLVVVAVALGAALSQFEVTRPWLGRIAKALVSPLVAGIDAAARSVPGLLLAALLVVLTAAGLRFARLLLDGVAQGRVEARLIRPARVPATRVGILVLTMLVIAPLVVAAAFGRFGTPLETLAVVAGGVVLLGALPVVGSAVVGLVLLWRGTLRAGDWIEIGEVHGEVSSVSVLDIVLVPESGGTVVVPMLALALRPLTRGAAPRVTLEAHLKRDRPWVELEPRLLGLARVIDPGAKVAILEVGEHSVRCELSVPLGKPDARHALAQQLVAAAERGELVILDAP